MPSGAPRDGAASEPWPTSQTSAPTRSASVVSPWAPASARNQPITATAMQHHAGRHRGEAGAARRDTVSGRASGSSAGPRWAPPNERANRPRRGRGSRRRAGVGGAAQQISHRPTILAEDRRRVRVRHAGSRRARHAQTLRPTTTGPSPSSTTSTSTSAPPVGAVQAYALTGDLSAARQRRRATPSSPPGTTGARSAGCPTPRSGSARAPGRWPSVGTWPGSGTARRASRAEQKARPRRPAPPARPAAQGAAARPTWRPCRPPSIGRELGERPARVEERLARRDRRRSARSTGTAADAAWQRAIESLAPIAEATALPAPAVIQRDGRRRRRLHRSAGPPSLLALVVGRRPVRRDARARTTRPARSHAGRGQAGDRRRCCSSPAQVQRPRSRLPAGVWPATSDNTAGTGINSVCQATRFADPRGTGTLRAHVVTTGGPDATVAGRRRSRSRGRTRPRRRRTARRWAGSPAAARRGCSCSDAYRVQGLGDEAQVLKLRIPNKPYAAPTSSASPAPGRSPSRRSRRRSAAARSPIDRAVTHADRRRPQRVPSDAAGTVPARPSRAAPVLPPPSGRDARARSRPPTSPSIGRINRPWVGTQPVPARPNIAATTCDKADFVRARSAAARPPAPS